MFDAYLYHAEGCYTSTYAIFPPKTSTRCHVTETWSTDTMPVLVAGPGSLELLVSRLSWPYVP